MDLVPVAFFGNNEYAWTNSLGQIIEVRPSADSLLSYCLAVIASEPLALISIKSIRKI
jgi:hypothetical protein